MPEQRPERLEALLGAERLFDKLIVGVAHNIEKKGLFDVNDRVEMIRDAIGDRDSFEIDTIDGLLVDYARSRGARVVIRGMRALADFEYEFEMALMNAHMYPEIETVFLMTSERWFYVSSSRLRELARFGTDIGEFVPEPVARRMREKFGPGPKA